MEDRFLGFRRYLVQQKRAAPNTVASYLRDVAGLDRFAGFSADIDYAAASPDLVSSYLNQLKDQGRKPSTLNRVRASISCYYRYLTEQGIANGNPAKSVPLPLPSRSIPAILTTAEMDRLLSAPNDHDILSCRDRAMLELLYATGLKVTALTALNVDDLHLDMGFLRSAGRHERMLPLYQTAVDKLREYIKRRPALLQDPGEPALFVNSNGGRLEDHQAACPPSRHPKGYHAPKFAPFLGHSSAAEWSHTPRPSADLGIRRSNRSPAVRQTVSPELDGKLQSTSSPGREKGELLTGEKGRRTFMSRAVGSSVLSLLGGIVGLFLGAFLNQPMEGAIVGTLVVGIGCIVYAVDQQERD